jgi:hypothetical protein
MLKMPVIYERLLSVNTLFCINQAWAMGPCARPIVEPFG